MKNFNRTILITFFCTFLYLIPLFLRYVISFDLFSITATFIYFILLLVVCGVAIIGGIVSIFVITITAIRKRKQNKIFIAIATVFLSMMILLLINRSLKKIILSDLPIGSNLLKFDSQIWKSEDSLITSGSISVRERMLKNVVRDILPGKNKNEIEQLLGPSLKTNYFKKVNKDIIYYLGPERTSIFNIDSEWLLIWLDENGIFKKYKIVND